MLHWRRSVILLLLVGSVALNLGVGTTIGIRAYQQYQWRCQRGGGPGLGPGGPGFGPGGPGHTSLAEVLHLTPEQAAVTNDARASLLRDISALRDQMRPEYEALSALMTADQPDRAAVAAQMDRIIALRGQMRKRLIDHFLNLKDMLDAQQRATFNDVVLKRMLAFEMFERGFGGPPPRGGMGRPGPRELPAGGGE